MGNEITDIKTKRTIPSQVKSSARQLHFKSELSVWSVSFESCTSNKKKRNRLNHAGDSRTLSTGIWTGGFSPGCETTPAGTKSATKSRHRYPPVALGSRAFSALSCGRLRGDVLVDEIEVIQLNRHQQGSVPLGAWMKSHETGRLLRIFRRTFRGT